MPAKPARRLRCAVYTRKSSEEGLEQAFNSLHAQREACEAYIASQAGEGWHLIRTRYVNGGVSGGTMERPALKRLLADITIRKVDTVLVYKVDRLTRSLADFAKIVEVFDAHGASFVSITQRFNTTTSMGRLTLNMLLSFAQFEREVTAERIRDKIAASKQKGMWMGGFSPLGYDVKDRKLVVNEAEAATVRHIFRRYAALGSVRCLKAELAAEGIVSKLRVSQSGRRWGGKRLGRGALYLMLQNRLYLGEIVHKDKSYPGEHAAIIGPDLWEAAQARLTANRVERSARDTANSASLLAGLLYDERGNRLSPSHAVKAGRRYRYYVSQALLQNREDDAGSIARIAAREIEHLVGGQIHAFLRDSGWLIDEFADPPTPRNQQRIIAAAKEQVDRWPQMNAAERRAFILRVLAGVTVGEGEIRIVLRRDALRHALLGDASSTYAASANWGEAGMPAGGDALTIRAAARLRKCSGEMRLVIPPGQATDQTSRPNAALIKALIRAHTWKDKLVSGEAPSIRAIVDEAGITERYVGRILRLAFLAPDIVEAIIDGYQPADLELERLLKGIPLAWGDQRRLFGFAPRGLTDARRRWSS
jgi:DNA invertase Pin-like site-specific DNA recombinase